jgi:hypothetical protein
LQEKVKVWPGRLMLDWAAMERRYRELGDLARVDRTIVERTEKTVAANPAKAITFDGEGRATVRAEGRAWNAGFFATPSMRELRAAATPGRCKSRFSAVLGSEPVTDIGFLQAAAPSGTTFQVASQFNCLEAPDEMVVPVARYLKDPTQGPRAAVSAFPAALVRHYAAPAGDGSRFVQTETRQLNLLADALPANVGKVSCGYLMAQNIPDRAAAADALEKNFESIRVGVARDVDVAMGANWDGAVPPGQRITQVLTSTFAGGGYSGDARIEGDIERIARALLRAAYLGTFLAAKDRVVLTLIGGGVFGNHHSLIFNSMLWALDERDRTCAQPLEVLLNARSLDDSLIPHLIAAEVLTRSGSLTEL